jgi:hypothetical protein
MVEEIKPEKSNKEFLIKFTLGAIFIISIVVIIGMKISSDISLKVPIIICVILGIFFLISLFGRKLYELKNKLTKEEKKNLEPISEEEVNAIITKKLTDELWNHKKIGYATIHETTTVNGSLIYQSKVPLLYEQKWKDGEKIIKSNTAIFIINANYPKIKPAVLEGTASEKRISNVVNRISQNPEITDVEETELSSDNFGRPVQKSKKTIHKQKEEEKEEKVV